MPRDRDHRSSGAEPLVLRFDMCESTRPVPPALTGSRWTACSGRPVPLDDHLHHRGRHPRHRASGPCGSSATSRTLRGPHEHPLARRPTTTRRPTGKLTVQVTSSGPGGCGTDTPGPGGAASRSRRRQRLPEPQRRIPSTSRPRRATPPPGTTVSRSVEYKVNYPGPDQQILGPVTSGSPWPYDWTAVRGQRVPRDGLRQVPRGPGLRRGRLRQRRPTRAKWQITINNTGPCVTPDPASPPAQSVERDLGERPRRSRGGAGAGRGQRRGGLPARGTEPVPGARCKRGENRVEATLVEARSGGTWRFELGATPGFRPESLRVVAGDVVQLAADSADVPPAGPARRAGRVRRPGSGGRAPARACVAQRRRLRTPISRTIASAAAPGSAASVIGRPTTR